MIEEGEERNYCEEGERGGKNLKEAQEGKLMNK